MANSTKETYPRVQIIPRRAFVSTPNSPSLLQQQVLRQETLVAKIEAKYYDLKFNGEEVKTFFKKIERIAQINGEKYEDLAMGMAFWKTDPKVSDAIEAIPGYGEGDFTQLKKGLIVKWGIVEPEKIYRKYFLIHNFNYTQYEGGTSTLLEYEIFIGVHKTLITYLLRYKYNPQENMFHEDVFSCLSTDVQGAISKEMI
ncbi:hypothetical protein O181_031422 [Austropuccinia psidii MF-1]|uniref:Uncharacterized protein n=1 Tax=Austropuccinia psidii MF-1 TaxID=1389203 RepID=A0A9Q3CXK5_9BASI|nr:hypothetical protein [Austropuccinia psidii MF-1]